MTTTTIPAEYRPALESDDFEGESFADRQARLKALGVPVFDPADLTPDEAARLLETVPNGWDYVWEALADRAENRHVPETHRDDDVEEPSSSGGHREGSGMRRSNGISDKQRAFILRLLGEKDLTASTAIREIDTLRNGGEALAEYLDSLTGGRDGTGSALIDALIALPYRRQENTDDRPSSGLDLSNLPSGRYAVPGGDTRLKIRVDNVEKGKWAGWVFVKDGAAYGNEKRYGAQRPGQTYQGEVEDALRTIAADPKAATVAYGRLVGRCGVCGRRLEDEASVEAGIGPVCAETF